jgi:hypothetical protein
MDIIKLLQKLKNIEADPEYTKMSRQRILNLSPERDGTFRTPWQFILHSLQFGSAVALATLLVVLTIGGLAAWESVSHIELSSLAPSNLKAEAEAIDVQIQLTDIVYSEPVGHSTTIPTIIVPKTDKIIEKIQKQAESLGLKPLPSPSSSMTIDEALDKLAD